MTVDQSRWKRQNYLKLTQPVHQRLQQPRQILPHWRAHSTDRSTLAAASLAWLPRIQRTHHFQGPRTSLTGRLGSRVTPCQTRVPGSVFTQL